MQIKRVMPSLFRGSRRYLAQQRSSAWLKPRRWLAGIAAALCLLVQALPVSSQEAVLVTFFKNYLEETFRLRPTDATQLGDHRFDHLLDDVSSNARSEWLAQARRTLDALPRQVDFSKLSRPSQVDYEILKGELEQAIWLAENTHPFEEDPRVYNGYLNGSVYLLLTQSTLPKETNVANAIARMGQIPKVIAAARENLTHPPLVHTETALRQNRGAIAFYEKDLFELAGETSQADQLKAAAAQVAAQLRAY